MITPITFVLLCLAFLVQRWEWRRSKKRADHWEQRYQRVSDSLLKRLDEVNDAKEAHSGLCKRFEDLCQENVRLNVRLKEQSEKASGQIDDLKSQLEESEHNFRELFDFKCYVFNKLHCLHTEIAEKFKKVNK